MENNPFTNGIVIIENDNNNYEENSGNELVNFFEEPKELFDLKIAINNNFKQLNPIFEILIKDLNKMEEIYKRNDIFKGKEIKIKEIAENIKEIETKLKKNKKDFNSTELNNYN